MSRLLLLLAVLFLATSSGCAAIGTAAGLYALSQTDLVQDQINGRD